MRPPFRTAWLVLAALLMPTAALPAGETLRDVQARDGDRAGPDFVSGRDVRLSGMVGDDVFAAGETVSLDGLAAEDLFLAGRAVGIRGGSARIVIAAAADLTLDTQVGDDVVAAAADLAIARTARIGGNAILAGRNVRLDGTVGGTARVAARRVELNGTIEGDAAFYAGEVAFAPGARVGGRLDLLRSAELTGSPSAVAGQVRMIDPDEIVPAGPPVGIPAGLMAAAFGFLGFAVLAGAAALVAPGFLASTATFLARSPGASLLTGIIVAIAAPPVIAIAMASVIGAPLGIVLLALLLVGFAAAAATAALWTGTTILSGFCKRAGPAGRAGLAGRAVLGAAALVVIGLLPWIGPLFCAGLLVLSLGAALRCAWNGGGFRTAPGGIEDGKREGKLTA